MIPLEHITSIKDPRVIEARELTSASGRARLHKCLLEGIESIQWAIEANLVIEHIFSLARQENEPFHRLLQEQSIPCFIVTEALLKKVSDTSYLIPYIWAG